jgi:hypothetical protein
VNIKNRLKLAAQLTGENLKYCLQKHPDRRLQIPWNFAQVGMLIFPLIPILGALGLFLGLAGTCKQKFRQISRRPLNRGFAILSALLVITAVFANNRIEAFLGLYNFLPFFILFAAFSSLIQTLPQLRHLSWMIVISSIPVIILGLGQQFLGWSGIDQLQPVFGWVLEPKGNPPGRMASVFMYANILACYLTIAFILALGLWIEGFARKKEGTTRILTRIHGLIIEQKSGVRSQESEGRGSREEGILMPNAQCPIPIFKFCSDRPGCCFNFY